MDTNITRLKPRARLFNAPYLKAPLWIVYCSRSEGAGLTLEQAYLDWQAQRQFRMFA